LLLVLLILVELFTFNVLKKSLKKVVIAVRNLKKDRQYYDQKKKDKRTNNNLFPPMHWYFLFSCHGSYIYFSVRIVKYLRIGLNCFSIHEEINSKMWYTLCNPRSGLCKGVYHIFEFITNEPNKTLWSILID
jgi:hypothetical protein